MNADVLVSIPFKREGTSKEINMDSVPSGQAECFHSLQTGRYRERTQKNPDIVIGGDAFPFPSNGKVQGKSFTSDRWFGTVFKVQFPSNGKGRGKPAQTTLKDLLYFREFPFPSNGKGRGKQYTYYVKRVYVFFVSIPFKREGTGKAGSR